MNPEYMMAMLPSLYGAKLLYDFKILDNALSQGFTEMTDDWFYNMYELMELCADFFAVDYDEDYDVTKWYFSNECMVEYYRLCRVYGSAHGMKLKDNPFMQKAERFVENVMDLLTEGFGWNLQTKIGHERASGLLFYFDCYFHGEYELMEALLEMREWYSNAVIKLRKTLLEERIIWLTALPAHREVAA